MQAKTHTRKLEKGETRLRGGEGRLGGVCSPGVPGPRGTAAPPQLQGQGEESQAGEKATLMP